ncbi:gamma-glutamyl-gamma-aminobutyrate hydrolase family protein [Kitasatospora sp. McL0602]|uniref:WXG100-like domain-containing protein n=1 Tax=Kitasatospora sp. McL0602 TaxID=3439530 RepID=UPI003F8A8275
MAVELPEPLQWILLLLAGTRWPEADEGELRDMAAEWRKAADDLEHAARSSDSAVQRALDGQQGNAAEALGKHWAQFTTGKGTEQDPGYFPGTIQACRGMGDMLEGMANSAETAKIQIIAQLGILAFEIATAEAEAPFTAGASLLEIPAAIAIGREAVTVILKKLLQEALKHAIKMGVQMGAINLMAQTIELAEGHRKSIDVKELGQAVEGGAISGAIGNQLGKELGAVGGKVLPKGAMESLGGKVVHGAATGVGTDVLTQLAMTGKVDPHSLLGSGLSGGAGVGLHAGAKGLRDHFNGPPKFAPPHTEIGGSATAGEGGPASSTQHGAGPDLAGAGSGSRPDEGSASGAVGSSGSSASDRSTYHGPDGSSSEKGSSGGLTPFGSDRPSGAEPGAGGGGSGLGANRPSENTGSAAPLPHEAPAPGPVGDRPLGGGALPHEAPVSEPVAVRDGLSTPEPVAERPSGDSPQFVREAAPEPVASHDVPPAREPVIEQPVRGETVVPHEAPVSEPVAVRDGLSTPEPVAERPSGDSPQFVREAAPEPAGSHDVPPMGEPAVEQPVRGETVVPHEAPVSEPVAVRDGLSTPEPVAERPSGDSPQFVREAAPEPAGSHDVPPMGEPAVEQPVRGETVVPQERAPEPVAARDGLSTPEPAVEQPVRGETVVPQERAPEPVASHDVPPMREPVAERPVSGETVAQFQPTAGHETGSPGYEPSGATAGGGHTGSTPNLNLPGGAHLGNGGAMPSLGTTHIDAARPVAAPPRQAAAPADHQNPVPDNVVPPAADAPATPAGSAGQVSVPPQFGPVHSTGPVGTGGGGSRTAPRPEAAPRPESSVPQPRPEAHTEPRTEPGGSRFRTQEQRQRQQEREQRQHEFVTREPSTPETPVEPKRDVPTMGQEERLHTIGNLTPEGRRSLATDKEFVAELRRNSTPDEFAESAAHLLVQVDPRTEQGGAARHEAQQQLARLLRNPEVAERLLTNGVEVVVVPKDVRMTDVPAFGNLKGRGLGGDSGHGRTWDDVRGSGGRKVAITEENLLGEKTTIGKGGNYADGYSTTTHEFAHAVHKFGLSPEQKQQVHQSFEQKRAGDADRTAEWADGTRRDTSGRDRENYSSTDEFEYFAQATNAHLSTNHGSDPLTGQDRNNGSHWAGQHEQTLKPLLDHLYGSDPLAVHTGGRANPVDHTEAVSGVGDFFRMAEGQAHDTPAHETPVPPHEQPEHGQPEHGQSQREPGAEEQPSPPPQAVSMEHEALAKNGMDTPERLVARLDQRLGNDPAGHQRAEELLGDGREHGFDEVLSAYLDHEVHSEGTGELVWAVNNEASPETLKYLFGSGEHGPEVIKDLGNPPEWTDRREFGKWLVTLPVKDKYQTILGLNELNLEAGNRLLYLGAGADVEHPLMTTGAKDFTFVSKTPAEELKGSQDALKASLEKYAAPGHEVTLRTDESGVDHYSVTGPDGKSVLDVRVHNQDYSEYLGAHPDEKFGFLMDKDSWLKDWKDHDNGALIQDLAPHVDENGYWISGTSLPELDGPPRPGHPDAPFGNHPTELQGGNWSGGEPLHLRQRTDAPADEFVHGGQQEPNHGWDKLSYIVGDFHEGDRVGQDRFLEVVQEFRDMAEYLPDGPPDSAALRDKIMEWAGGRTDGFTPDPDAVRRVLDGADDFNEPAPPPPTRKDSLGRDNPVRVPEEQPAPPPPSAGERRTDPDTGRILPDEEKVRKVTDFLNNRPQGDPVQVGISYRTDGFSRGNPGGAYVSHDKASWEGAKPSEQLVAEGREPAAGQPDKPGLPRIEQDSLPPNSEGSAASPPARLDDPAAHLQDKDLLYIPGAANANDRQLEPKDEPKLKDHKRVVNPVPLEDRLTELRSDKERLEQLQSDLTAKKARVEQQGEGEPRETFNKKERNRLAAIPGELKKNEAESTKVAKEAEKARRVYDEHQQRASYELKLIDHARKTGMPILAVCGGSWRLGESYGATMGTFPKSEMDQHQADGWNLRHGMTTEPGTLLHGVINHGGPKDPSGAPVVSQVNSTHWAAVLEEQGLLTSGEGNSPLVISARASGTESASVEAFEGRHGAPVVGIQWHPEGNLPGMQGRNGIEARHPEDPLYQQEREQGRQADAIFEAMTQAGQSYRRRQNMVEDFKSTFEPQDYGAVEHPGLRSDTGGHDDEPSPPPPTPHDEDLPSPPPPTEGDISRAGDQKALEKAGLDLHNAPDALQERLEQKFPAPDAGAPDRVREALANGGGFDEVLSAHLGHELHSDGTGDLVNAMQNGASADTVKYLFGSGERTPEVDRQLGSHPSWVEPRELGRWAMGASMQGRNEPLVRLNEGLAQGEHGGGSLLYLGGDADIEHALFTTGTKDLTIVSTDPNVSDRTQFLESTGSVVREKLEKYAPGHTVTAEPIGTDGTHFSVRDAEGNSVMDVRYHAQTYDEFLHGSGADKKFDFLMEKDSWFGDWKPTHAEVVGSIGGALKDGGHWIGGFEPGLSAGTDRLFQDRTEEFTPDGPAHWGGQERLNVRQRVEDQGAPRQPGDDQGVLETWDKANMVLKGYPAVEGMSVGAFHEEVVQSVADYVLTSLPENQRHTGAVAGKLADWFEKAGNQRPDPAAIKEILDRADPYEDEPSPPPPGPDFQPGPVRPADHAPEDIGHVPPTGGRKRGRDEEPPTDGDEHAVAEPRPEVKRPRTRAYEDSPAVRESRGLRPPTAEQQDAVRQATGGERFPKPTPELLQAVNPHGRSLDGSSLHSCLEATDALRDTHYGRPRPSDVPLTGRPETDAAWTLLKRAEAPRSFGDGRTGIEALVRQVREGGPGTFSTVLLGRRGSEGHALALIHGEDGVLRWADPSTGSVRTLEEQPIPPRFGNGDHVWAATAGPAEEHVPGGEHDPDMFGADAPEFGALPPLPPAEHAALVHDLHQDPVATLQDRMISSDPVRGLRARHEGQLDENQIPMLLKWIEGREGPEPRPTTHWYVLTPDQGRETPDRTAFQMTPAVEKYLQDSPHLAEYLRLGPEQLAAIQGLGMPDGAYLRPSLVPYHAGQPNAEGVGSALVGGPDAPDLVVTPAMNGCAFVISGGSDVHQPFTATHFQSPKSFQPAMERFIRDNAVSDWFGDQEYARQTHLEQGRSFDVTNFLWRSGPGQPWHVVSQEMSGPADGPDGSTVVERTQSRPIDFAPLTEEQKTGLVLSLKAKFDWEKTSHRDIVDLVGRLPQGERRTALEALARTMRDGVDQDMAQLRAASSRQELLDAAEAVRARRSDADFLGRLNGLKDDVAFGAAMDAALAVGADQAAAKKIAGDVERNGRTITELITRHQEMEWLDTFLREQGL